MTIINSFVKDVEKLIPSYIADGNAKTIQLLWKTVWQFSKILNIELQHDPAIPPLAVHPQDMMKTISMQKLVHECLYQHSS